MSEIVTPYVSQDLFLTRAFDDEFANQLVDRGDRNKPFPRKIDLWWVAIMVGVSEGHRTPMPKSQELIKFNNGGIFGREPWRVTCLELLALAEEGEKVIEKPSAVITIGHEYAMTGLEWLASELRGSAKPTINLMTQLGSLLNC